MRHLIRRSLMIGTLLTISLVILGQLLIKIKSLGQLSLAIDFLLVPGVTLISAFGAMRIHDMDSWLLVIVANCLFYSIIALVIFGLLERYTRTQR